MIWERTDDYLVHVRAYLRDLRGAGDVSILRHRRVRPPLVTLRAVAARPAALTSGASDAGDALSRLASGLHER